MTRTPALTLRRWQPGDAAWYASAVRDPAIQQFTNEPDDLDTGTARINIAHAAVSATSFAIADAATGELYGNIGYHHVHHISAAIPNYRLVDCHRENEDLFVDQFHPYLSVLDKARGSSAKYSRITAGASCGGMVFQTAPDLQRRARPCPAPALGQSRFPHIHGHG